MKTYICSVILVMLGVSYSYSQTEPAIYINGPYVVCKNTIHTYTAQINENGCDCELEEFEWTVQGGEVMSETPHEITIRWISDEPKYVKYQGVFGPFGPGGDDVHYNPTAQRNVSFFPQPEIKMKPFDQLYYGKDDTISVGFENTSPFLANNQLIIDWELFEENRWNDLTVHTADFHKKLTISGSYRFRVTVKSKSCPDNNIYRKSATSPVLQVKKKLNNLSFISRNPTCKDRVDGYIEISDLPDPSELSYYEDAEFTENPNQYTFTVARYVACIPANGCNIDSFDKDNVYYDNHDIPYVRDGEGYSFVANYNELGEVVVLDTNRKFYTYEAVTKDSIAEFCRELFDYRNKIIDTVCNSFLVQYEELVPVDTSCMKLSEGIYEIQVGNDLYYSSYKEFVKLTEPDPLKLINVTYPSYSWDENTYHFKSNNASSEVTLEAEGGTKPYTFILGSVSAEESQANETTLTIESQGNLSININDKYNCPFHIAEDIPEEIKEDTSFNLIKPGKLKLEEEDYSPVDVSCNENDSGEHGDGRFVINNVRGGIGPYTIETKVGGEAISNETNIDNPYNTFLDSLPTGTYEFTLTDRFGSEYSFSEVISEPKPLNFNITDTIPPKCLGGNTGIIKADLDSDNGSAFTVESILNGETVDISDVNEDSIIIHGLEDNEQYNFKLEDSKGCSNLFSKIIGENPNPVQPGELTPIMPTCFGDNDGRIRVTAEGGDPSEEGYTFGLLNDSYSTYVGNNQTELGDLSGDAVEYIVYVEDSHECISGGGPVDISRYTKTIILNQPDLIAIHLESILGVSKPGAVDGSAEFFFSGGNEKYAYTLIEEEKDGLDTVVNGNTGLESVILENLPAGTYKLEVQDTCGCNNGTGVEKTITIEEPDTLKLIEDMHSDASCHGMNDGKIECRATGGWHKNGKYDFKIGNSSDWINDKSNISIDTLSSGVYKVYVRDNRDVIDSVEVIVGEPESLIVEVGSVTNASCHGEDNGGIDFDASGGNGDYSYSLDDGQTWTLSSQAGQLTAGDYHIIAEDNKGCRDTVSATIYQPELMDTAGLRKVDARCGDPVGQLAVEMKGGTLPYKYSWYKIDQLTKSDLLVGTDSVLNSIISGFYRLEVTDGNGCVQIYDSLGISDSNGPKVYDNLTQPVTCNGYSDGSALFSVRKGVQPFDVYYMSSENSSVGDSLIDTHKRNFLIEELPAGKYSLIIIDSLGCKHISGFEVKSKEPIEISSTATRPTCYGYDDGLIELNAAGGNGMYEFFWDNGEEGSVHENLTAGVYTVTVEDALGCSRVFEVELEQQQKILLDLGGEAVICEGMEYTMNPEGYATYLWEKDGEVISREEEIIVDEPGDYFLEVTTGEGCMASDTLTLKVDNELLDANFLMPTKASVNDTIAAIDISYPEPDSVAWSFEGSPRIFDWEPSESNPYTRFIQYTEKGTYAVMLFSVKAECRDSLVKNIQITESTRDTSEKKHLGADAFIRSFKLYPNPSAGTFKAEVKLKKRVPILLEVRDLKYQKVIDQQMKTGSREYTVYYQFRNLSPGIYLVILKVENEQKTIRIIIT